MEGSYPPVCQVDVVPSSPILIIVQIDLTRWHVNSVRLLIRCIIFVLSIHLSFSFSFNFIFQSQNRRPSLPSANEPKKSLGIWGRVVCIPKIETFHFTGRTRGGAEMAKLSIVDLFFIAGTRYSRWSTLFFAVVHLPSCPCTLFLKGAYETQIITSILYSVVLPYFIQTTLPNFALRTYPHNSATHRSPCVSVAYLALSFICSLYRSAIFMAPAYLPFLRLYNPDIHPRIFFLIPHSLTHPHLLTIPLHL